MVLSPHNAKGHRPLGALYLLIDKKVAPADAFVQKEQVVPTLYNFGHLGSGLVSQRGIAAHYLA